MLIKSIAILAILVVTMSLSGSSSTQAGVSFVPDVARYVDNVNYRDPMWIVRVSTVRGDLFVQAGPAETRLSGQSGTITFDQDEAILGFRIILANGRVMQNAGCFLRAAPSSGTVTDGVVNPPGAAIRGMRYCVDADFQAPPRLSGAGTIPFAKGEAVVGYRITIGSREFRDCYMADAPDNGQVTDGVVNPPLEAISGKRAC